MTEETKEGETTIELAKVENVDKETNKEKKPQSKKIITNPLNIIIRYPNREITDQNEREKFSSDIEKNKNLIKSNPSDIVTLKLENVLDNDVINLIMNSNIENLNLLTLENCPPAQKIYDSLPNLEKVSLRYLMPFTVFDMVAKTPENLKELYLEKNNLGNRELETLMKNIFKDNNSILQNLEVLSFAGNNLTKADLTFIPSKTIYFALEQLNFRKNRITKIVYDIQIFPKIKFINICKNNCNRSYLGDIANLASLESGNPFLFEPELCEKYYTKLKKSLKDDEKNLYIMDYLNFSYIPKKDSIKYFSDLIITPNILKNIKKLDLSYNGIDCNTFFKFINQNKELINLRVLNLNGNEIDDTFFEKFLELKCMEKLEHLYLNSNKIGDMNIKIKYKDQEPIDKKYSSEKEKLLIYKLRLIYNFIEKNKKLTKLTITKNPISEFYSVVHEAKNDADKNEKYVKRSNDKIVINCLFSMLIKIRDELLKSDKDRGKFNLRFDCRSNVNRNSENYPYGDKPFIYKK